MYPIKTTILIFFIFWGAMVRAQHTPVVQLDSPGDEGLKINRYAARKMDATNKLNKISFVGRSTPGGNFTEIRAEGFHKSFRKGYPDLPVKTKLIEIPEGARVKVNIKDYREEEVSLSREGIKEKIVPAQPSSPKREDDKQPFHYNKRVYQTNRYIGKEPVTVEEIGTMRGIRLGRLEISPFRYNPAKNELKVISDLDFEVVFEGAHSTSTGKKGKNLANPFFYPVAKSTINSDNTGTISNLFSADSPITYVIIAPPQYRSHLQPFVRWKTKKGFNVVQGYTDSIGSSKESIKSFIKELYENPEVSSPSFALFVGDVAQIPTWESNAGGAHVTDLYYCEFTGDKLPEMYYGRFPAADTSQLKTMIEKTLSYEKYTLEDPAYLREALLVAGNDENYEEKHANGQVNYGTTVYFNQGNNINAHAFLQDPPAGNGAIQDSIVTNMNRGLGFATYTGHCLSNGWSEPGFNLDDIAALTSEGKYGLWISNCCWSMKFDKPESFGEAALRAKNKGAVGAIGASDETYWDEDYWWGVGLTSSILSNPTYKESGLGLYDRMFHTHGENPNEWYVTQGQMVTAGNLAVEASGSAYSGYYWEVYHLMGDPSLMPYLGEPEPLSVTHTPAGITMGLDSLIVNTEPYAYVALSFEGELLAAESANKKGKASLSFQELRNPGDVSLVVTAQNKQPYISNTFLKPHNQPYLIADSTMVIDSLGNNNGRIDQGETIELRVWLKNISDSFSAWEVTDSLYSSDPNVEVIENYQELGLINSGSLSEKPAEFLIRISDSLQDQQSIELEMDIGGRDAEGSNYVWHSKLHYTVNAPSLKIGQLILNDGEMGNDSIDPGETAEAKVVVHNEGHSQAEQVTGTLNVAHASAPLVLNNSADSLGLVEAHATDTLRFKITADSSSAEGLPVYLDIKVSGGVRKQYTTDIRKRIIIGETPQYLMHNDTITTCYGFFYDTGGPKENYSNHETHRLTFLPLRANKSLRVDFISFGVEKDYDSLRIFDGKSVNSHLIGKYDNNHVPGQITATNPSGALTFEFISDGSITKFGWKAEVYSIPRDTIVLEIADGKSPVEGAQVVINADTTFSDSNGEALIVLNDGTYHYSILKEGYQKLEGTLEVSENMALEFVLRKKLYDIAFNLYGADEGKRLDGKVTLDGNKVSTLDGNCTFSNIWGLGTHSYKVEVPGYQLDSGEMQLNSDTVVVVRLKKIRYPVEIKVFDRYDKPLDSVLMQVDSIQEYTNEAGKGVLHLTEGKYTIQLKKEHYADYTGKIEIDEDTLSLSIHLDRLYSIHFSVLSKRDSQYVNNAEIVLDTLELQTDSLGDALTRLTKGEYEYTVEASGYKTHESIVQVSSNMTEKVFLAEKNVAAMALEGDKLILYPNPSDGLVHLINNGTYRLISVKIFDLAGNLIYNKYLRGSHNTLDLTSFNEGMYLIQLSIDRDQVIRKLILQ
jgi:hypothetical protein